MKPILGVALLVAFGCGRGATPPPAVEEVVVRFAQVGTVSTLDPTRSGWVVEARVLEQLADGLVDVDAGLQIRPALADSWEILDGGRTYRFRLRDGVTSGNGLPLTSADVAAALARLASPGALTGWTVLADVEGAEEYRAGRAPSIAGIQAPDPRTLVFRLKTASSRFLYQLGTANAVIFGGHGSLEDWARGRVAGSGPFRLEAWEDLEEAGLRFQRFRFSARPGQPSPPRVAKMVWDLYKSWPDLRRRVHDVSYDVLYAPPTEAASADTALPHHRVKTTSRMGFMAVYFDCQKPPVDRAEVRRAIALAADRDALGRENLLAGYTLPGTIGPFPEEALLRRDVATAAALARKAGLDPARPVTLRIANSASAEYGDLALWVRGPFADSVAPLGLKLELVQVADGSALDERFFSRRDHAYVYGSTPELVDPCMFFEAFRSANLNSNWSWYSRREVDEAYRDCARSMDMLTQRSAIQRAIPLIASDAPILPLTTTHQRVYVAPRIEGFVPTPLEGIDFRGVGVRPEP